jgi:hypothetical protein
MSTYIVDILLMNVENGKNGTRELVPIPELVRSKILDAVAGIRFGAVEIIIHEGKVVQIERKERLRLEK